MYKKKLKKIKSVDNLAILTERNRRSLEGEEGYLGQRDLGEIGGCLMQDFVMYTPL